MSLTLVHCFVNRVFRLTGAELGSAHGLYVGMLYTIRRRRPSRFHPAVLEYLPPAIGALQVPTGAHAYFTQKTTAQDWSWCYNHGLACGCGKPLFLPVALHPVAITQHKRAWPTHSPRQEREPVWSARIRGCGDARQSEQPQSISRSWRCTTGKNCGPPES